MKLFVRILGLLMCVFISFSLSRNCEADDREDVLNYLAQVRAVESWYSSYCAKDEEAGRREWTPQVRSALMSCYFNMSQKALDLIKNIVPPEIEAVKDHHNNFIQSTELMIKEFDSANKNDQGKSFDYGRQSSSIRSKMMHQRSELDKQYKIKDQEVIELETKVKLDTPK